MPEFEEEGRRLVPAGCISARCSGLRAVENFLDLAHFPFVHPNILGIEEQAGIEQYEVEIAESGNEIWATECKFYRPLAGAFGEQFGEIGHYKYRVAHPFSAIIYKTCPIKEDAWDLIGLFIQPVEEDRSDLHPFLLVFDEDYSDTDPASVPAVHLSSGSVDPGEPGPLATTARSAARAADPGRCLLDRISPLAHGKRRDLRRNSARQSGVSGELS